MTVTCPECSSIFRVDPAKVPVTGVRARCSVCGGVISIPAGALPVTVTPAAGVGAVRVPPRAATPVASLRTVARLTPTGVAPIPSPPVRSAVTPMAVPAAISGASSFAPPRSPDVPTAQQATTGTPSTARRPINPFLKADPQERARRLARALVSDLVAYHPQKREAGLRDGNLRQLFRDEIKKSYEEYIEQVGRESAEASSHFQDALNEILAGGNRVF